VDRCRRNASKTCAASGIADCTTKRACAGDKVECRCVQDKCVQSVRDPEPVVDPVPPAAAGDLMLYAQLHLTLPAWVHEAVDTTRTYAERRRQGVAGDRPLAPQHRGAHGRPVRCRRVRSRTIASSPSA
jgi:hypothetical protein